MSEIKRWCLVVGAASSIIVGALLGISFMLTTIKIFDVAMDTAGRNPVQLIINLASGIKGILAWIVFGIVMTNATIIASSLSIVSMLTPRDSK